MNRAPLANCFLSPKLSAIPMVSTLAGYYATHHHWDPSRKETGEEISEEWFAGVDDVRRNGVLNPVHAIVHQEEGQPPRYEIVDGRHRFQWSQEAGLKDIPFVECSPVDADRIIYASFARRRHCKKSTLAWFGICLHPEIALTTPHRAAKNQCAKNAHHETGEEIPENQSKLAADLGVSRRLVVEACILFRELENLKARAGDAEAAGLRDDAQDLRDRVEMANFQAWAGDGFGAIRAGLAGLEKSAPQRTPSNPNSATRTLFSLASQLSGWATWSAEDRAAAGQVLLALVTPKTLLEVKGKQRPAPLLPYDVVALLAAQCQKALAQKADFETQDQWATEHNTKPVKERNRAKRIEEGKKINPDANAGMGDNPAGLTAKELAKKQAAERLAVRIELAKPRQDIIHELNRLFRKHGESADHNAAHQLMQQILEVAEEATAAELEIVEIAQSSPQHRRILETLREGRDNTAPPSLADTATASESAAPTMGGSSHAA